MRVVFHRAYPSGFSPFGVVVVSSQPTPERFPKAFSIWFLRAQRKNQVSPGGFAASFRRSYCATSDGSPATEVHWRSCCEMRWRSLSCLARKMARKDSDRITLPTVSGSLVWSL